MSTDRDFRLALWLGAALLALLMFWSFCTEMAKNKNESRAEQSCIKAGKSWTHNDNGWGECK